MTQDEAKELLKTQLTDLAETTGKKLVEDLSEYIADGKHEAMQKLAVRALKLKAKALLADTPEKRKEIVDDLEFTFDLGDV